MPRVWTLITAAHRSSELFVKVSVHKSRNPPSGLLHVTWQCWMWRWSGGKFALHRAACSFFQTECTLYSTITVMFVSGGNTDTSADAEDTLSPASTKEKGMIKPRGNSRYASVKDQVHFHSIFFFSSRCPDLYMEISNGDSRSGGSDEATTNLVMTELLDLLASAVPPDTAAGKCKATHLFFGDVVRLFPFPKKTLPCVVL